MAMANETIVSPAVSRLTQDPRRAAVAVARSTGTISFPQVDIASPLVLSGSPLFAGRPVKSPEFYADLVSLAVTTQPNATMTAAIWFTIRPMNPSKKDDCLTPAELVRTEAAALETLAARLEGPMAADFERAVELIVRCGEGNGRVVVTGMGKSGIIAQKIAATLSSTGSPALFLHPAEAVHGDLGVLMPGDVVIALSASGETEEILRLLATLKAQG